LQAPYFFVDPTPDFQALLSVDSADNIQKMLQTTTHFLEGLSKSDWTNDTLRAALNKLAKQEKLGKTYFSVLRRAISGMEVQN
jgi:hypothetical protein